MLETTLYIAYYVVAFLYLGCGVLLLLMPQYVENKIPPLFPLLASFRYQRIANSINLVGVGAVLLIVGKLIASFNAIGVFVALIFSALEVYLGIRFYYLEERDALQAVLHFVLHIVIVGVVGWLLLSHYSIDIANAHHQAAALLSDM